MKKTILALALVAITGSLFAQKKTTTSATVAFDASTAIDALPKAENKTVVAALDAKAGTVAFEATVKNFAFTNPTIQEHFNGEKWLNSDKFPTFTFKGNILDASKVNFAKDGTYNTNVEGTLSVKGVEQKVKAPATIVVKSGVVTATSNFSFKLADFGITGAPIDGGKVAKEPKVTVSAEFK
ncbi:YceI family protein [Terrimonas sp. NA20]|uniref:YceI family protein n=1 Tax=Terrimonas ginsenosidimutans TaxID=2908004 RepID=A0ABS9KL94_9BACT|nr:YceI family protein [Terrimonas ginsenosidimutans]MCG2613089.1 YceI family protein [Terrimonas ginsenosidimutans]